MRGFSTLTTLVLLLTLHSTIALASVKVEVEGIKGKLASNVRAYLSIAEVGKEPIAEIELRRLHHRATAEIGAALQPFGYYHPRVESTLEPAGKGWRARYVVEKGPMTRIAALDLRIQGPGGDNAALRAVLAASTLRAGQRLVHSDYEDTKSALMVVAYDQGYLDAHFERARIEVNTRTRSADVALVFNSGRQWVFGDVRIAQTILDDTFVQRFVRFAPGDHFDSRKLTQLQLDLGDSDYFSHVEIETERPPAAGRDGQAPRMPVVVRTQPAKPRKFLASAGYGTDTGPRLGLGMELRRLNRYGHKFRSDLRLSTLKQSLTTRYRVPVRDVARDEFSLGFTARREELGDAETEAGVLFAALDDNWRGLRRRLYLNLEQERYRIDGEVSERSDMLYAGITLIHRKVDDPLRVRNGFGLTYDLRGASDSLISSVDFLQATATGAAVWSPAASTRLLGRGKIGGTSVSDFDELPPSLRYFSGGDHSVRGYAYQSISPENALGASVGGRYLMEARFEVEQRLYGDYGAALFFDAGEARNDTQFDLSRSVGIGFRWLSPVGTLRLDIAHPVDDPDKSVRFHFSLGPDI